MQSYGVEVLPTVREKQKYEATLASLQKGQGQAPEPGFVEKVWLLNVLGPGLVEMVWFLIALEPGFVEKVWFLIVPEPWFVETRNGLITYSFLLFNFENFI